VLTVCTIHLEFDRIGLDVPKKDNVHDNRGLGRSNSGLQASHLRKVPIELLKSLVGGDPKRPQDRGHAKLGLVPARRPQHSSIHILHCSLTLSSCSTQ
jgi:hypothetical protein